MEEELRERRRAKLLASKEARMARIIGSTKTENGEKPSIVVDEAKIEEFINNAKEAQSGNDDSNLNKNQIETKQKDQIPSPMQNNGKNPLFYKIIGLLVTVLSAVFSSFWIKDQIGSKCLYSVFNDPLSIKLTKTCSINFDSVFLKIVLPLLVVSLLPVFNEFLFLINDSQGPRNKNYFGLGHSILRRVCLFIVILMVSLKFFTIFKF
jgi:hypothetical protein